MRMEKRRILFCLSVLLALLIGGCQSNSPATPVKTQAAINDPSAIQLQNISGAILTYYAINKQLPDNLQEAAGYLDVPTPLVESDSLSFVSPTSHKRYVYASNGLTVIGKDKYVIVYEPEPNADGNRWCIFMTPPTPGKPISLEVVAIPEAVFQTYQPAGQ